MAGLRGLAEALPRDSCVPVPCAWLLEILAGTSVAATAAASADLTVAEVAVRFGRQGSTVRGWLERGLIGGAYRFQGREWRIPLASLTAFEADQRTGKTERPSGASATRRGRPVDLGAWRDAS